MLGIPTTEQSWREALHSIAVTAMYTSSGLTTKSDRATYDDLGSALLLSKKFETTAWNGHSGRLIRTGDESDKDGVSSGPNP